MSLNPTLWTVGERHHGWRLDLYLKEQIPRLSRTRIASLVAERITLSWRKKATPGTRMVAGGTVAAGYPRLHEVPSNIEYPIVFEDDRMLVIDKPPGAVVHPTNSCRENSVIEIIRRTRNDPELRLVHRLDRETSGALIFAKSADSARLFGRALQRREISKTYLARVLNRPPTPEGEITAPIAKHPSSQVYVRRAVVAGGESAATRFRTLSYDDKSSVLELHPLTGRTHQLRVHLESIGCPIVGDFLYGRDDELYLSVVRGEAKPQRLELHAWKMSGTVGGRSFAVETALPSFISSDFR